MGTAMVTPARASAYCSARLPKNMQKPEAIANPISGAFSCRNTAPVGWYVSHLVIVSV